MKILVTGAAGFMGSHLVDKLVEEGHEVYSLDDLSGGFIENVNPKSRFIQLDLRNKEATENLIKEVEPELIFHLAADATEGRSQFTPIECTARNLTAYLNLLVPAIKHGTKKMVMFSSMAVYGNQSPPFDEDLEPRPEDVYGVSKAAMENVTKILSEVYGFKYTILRPHNVYGPRQNMADPYRNVIAIFMNCLLRNKTFYIYGDGEQRRAFSYINGQVPCMVKAGFDNKVDGKIINIGPAKEVSINKVAELVLKVSGKNFRPVYMPERPREVKNAWCTNDKAARLLGYRDTLSLEEGIKRMWEWAKSFGPRTPRYIENMELSNAKIPETWKNKLI
jgi:UDP-glucose 4-epimerase